MKLEPFFFLLLLHFVKQKPAEFRKTNKKNLRKRDKNEELFLFNCSSLVYFHRSWLFFSILHISHPSRNKNIISAHRERLNFTAFFFFYSSGNLFHFFFFNFFPSEKKGLHGYDFDFLSSFNIVFFLFSQFEHHQRKIIC